MQSTIGAGAYKIQTLEKEMTESDNQCMQQLGTLKMNYEKAYNNITESAVQLQVLQRLARQRADLGADGRQVLAREVARAARPRHAHLAVARPDDGRRRHVVLGAVDEGLMVRSVWRLLGFVVSGRGSADVALLLG